jgi:hypothetical protein
MTFGRGFQQRSIEELVKSEHGPGSKGGPERDDGSRRRGCTVIPVLIAIPITLLLSGSPRNGG